VKPLSPKELRLIESCRDNTRWTAEDAAKHLNLPISEVRRIYAEGKR